MLEDRKKNDIILENENTRKSSFIDAKNKIFFR